MNIKPNILIFSVFQKGNSLKANTLNHKIVLNRLTESNLPITTLRGKYEGTEELSILVEGFNNRELVETYCREYNQECYLESHSDRATSLVFPDGSRQKIGTLTPVSKTEAEKVGNWSYSPVLNQYYVTC